MGKEKTTKSIAIKPLFLSISDQNMIDQQIIKFAKDDYNKNIGEALIDAKNDFQAIITFLQEYKDSPETLRWVQLHNRV